ncbi:pogo transposable element with KRAB domain [Rhizophagus clarus]|uniref:Pogo transposable element with KRAB domain n=1 Tax=Rhizophagus clarus TaxID=94130 RepID=A0A8H3LS63_9GLOM|nr:pogo transposable element with KRAB domain [Rhizophagus clarus]
MNKNEILFWIENVWIKCERLFNPQSLLVLDLFSAHIVNSVKKRFSKNKTDIAVIPGGLTSRLQPLDVSHIGSNIPSKPNDEIALLSDKEDENTSDEGYKTDTSKEKHETDGSDEEFGNNKSDEESENDESDEMKRINLMRVNMRKWRMMAIQIIMMNKEQITLMYGSSKMGGFNCIIIAN